MSVYKTIIVHFADEQHAERQIAVATRLALDHDAHLIGLFLGWPDVLSAPRGVGRSLVESGRAAIRARSEQLRTLFDAAGAGLQLKKEWRFIEPHGAPVPDTIMNQVRSADLIVTAQGSPDWDASFLMECPEELLLSSGRPVLFVPNAGSIADFTRRITVAWSDRREASRAAWDALPLLQRADSVRVLWVDPEARATGDDQDPTRDVLKALLRHGVKAVGARTHGGNIGVGTELLGQVAVNGATMLVMGGYGRMRLSESIFGGATRHVLKYMTVPVLMSH